jgi:hypothetical protein
LTAEYTCLQAAEEVVQNTPVLSYVEGNIKEQAANTLHTKVEVAKQRIGENKKKQKAAFNKVIQAIGWKLISTVQRSLITSLVEKVKRERGVGDFLGAADEIAANIYQIKYISKNFSGDKQRELMVGTVMRA